jgi:hypothetical protein
MRHIDHGHRDLGHSGLYGSTHAVFAFRHPIVAIVMMHLDGIAFQGWYLPISPRLHECPASGVFLTDRLPFMARHAPERIKNLVFRVAIRMQMLTFGQPVTPIA